MHPAFHRSQSYNTSLEGLSDPILKRYSVILTPITQGQGLKQHVFFMSKQECKALVSLKPSTSKQTPANYALFMPSCFVYRGNPQSENRLLLQFLRKEKERLKVRGGYIPMKRLEPINKQCQLCSQPKVTDYSAHLKSSAHAESVARNEWIYKLIDLELEELTKPLPALAGKKACTEKVMDFKKPRRKHPEMAEESNKQAEFILKAY